MQLFKVVEYTYSFEFCPGTNRGLSGYETFYTPRLNYVAAAVALQVAGSPKRKS